jgi:DNA-directed RNA polymerase specialized sigma24 family protein
MTDQLPPARISRFHAGITITRHGRPGLMAPGPGLGQRAGSRADEALTRIYAEHSGPLTGLAALLVWAAEQPSDVLLMTKTTFSAYVYREPSATRNPEFGHIPGVPPIGTIPGAIQEIAEEIVQDALAAMHREWHRLRDADRALAYLRRAIVYRARVHRRALSAGQDARADPCNSGNPSATSLVVLAALRRLPGQQREALVLRYYADLPDTAAADAMGVTRAAFRGHAARGMNALGLLLDKCHSETGGH